MLFDAEIARCPKLLNYVSPHLNCVQKLRFHFCPNVKPGTTVYAWGYYLLHCVWPKQGCDAGQGMILVHSVQNREGHFALVCPNKLLYAGYCLHD